MVVCWVPARRLRLSSTLCAGLAQLEVDLAAAAELAQEQEQPDTQQEAAVVDQPVWVAAVGKGVQPVVELGEEVADGADQQRADVQGRPRLAFLLLGVSRTRATVSWWISASRALMRLCSAIHERTSSRRSRGT